MDFRTTAAEMTLRRTQDPRGAALAQLNDSGCLEIPGGRSTHCLVEIPFLVFSLGWLIAIFAIMVLRSVGIISPLWSLGLSSILLVIGLFSRMIKSLILRAFLHLRADSLLRAVPGLPRVTVGLEHGATYKKVKLLPEDQGVCLLDASNARILIEGCSYRYAIFARDVNSIQPVSGYAMSGARLQCQIAGSSFDVVLTSHGQGPIASLVQTFSPSTGASSLAARLTKTLSGIDAPSYIKTPPLISEAR
jgi:hypothetical protein